MKKQILTYSGKVGLLRVTKNSLRAKGEILIFETSYSSLNAMFTKKQAEEIRNEFINKKIKIRELTNQAYHEPYTEIEGYHEKVMNIRYISPNKLKINMETLIYNNVVTIYEAKKDGFCLEIYSKELADQQRQLFEFVWKQADRPIIGRGGRTSIS
ncbi:hypothetical protein A2686_04240 [Candidatus Woesebacteria bacterium RIFCSPHIGHO2_01_FULL_38_10]|uniref:Uncharacterized protein n=1 Tax=Candidatus Woesebacteria bacterium RIFCSPLOWO2_01_FULL_39_10b TaxID=1802517 RepID=A0A1F8B8H2_9BACT|nr:MAG: hypothetical protein A2686_04240 [Candidatus Woesebacteria bacterium RIFCSPHIGHO2_01_FULL_38_10]OGM60317.1 MAG: hypothetical protein A2892_03150 [Candidatus Woesebacteria bacterium RIFCSPLOWO2_01_FULL_39_10b]